jgi:2-keto-4-pentenoate hydratase/2-oxohepta-3-ene-1,7-dioic acid hydratase in catechol pathway
MSIQNIYCIGRNYSQHAKELGNEVPQEPIVFMKPTHAVRKLDGTSVALEGGRGSVHYEVEIVLRVDKRYDPGMEPDDCIGAMTLGIDLTLRDVQKRLTGAGLPWLDAKGFLSSALLADWFAYPGAAALEGREFALLRSGEQVQRGHAGQMIFKIAQLVEHIGRRPHLHRNAGRRGSGQRRRLA